MVEATKNEVVRRVAVSSIALLGDLRRLVSPTPPCKWLQSSATAAPLAFHRGRARLHTSWTEEFMRTLPISKDLWKENRDHIANPKEQGP
jgi:hypothetical protein